jgi:hypothetical protein
MDWPFLKVCQSDISRNREFVVLHTDRHPRFRAAPSVLVSILGRAEVYRTVRTIYSSYTPANAAAVLILLPALPLRRKRRIPTLPANQRPSHF